MILGTTKPDTSFVIFHNPWPDKKDEAVQKTKDNAVSKCLVVSTAASADDAFSRTLSELNCNLADCLYYYVLTYSY